MGAGGFGRDGCGVFEVEGGWDNACRTNTLKCILVFSIPKCESGDGVRVCTCVICCSFGVVLWELLTGEKPYSGLNMCAIIFGVGHGTLSLPIPEGCPDFLRGLLNGTFVCMCVREEGVQQVCRVVCANL